MRQRNKDFVYDERHTAKVRPITDNDVQIDGWARPPQLSGGAESALSVCDEVPTDLPCTRLTLISRPRLRLRRLSRRRLSFRPTLSLHPPPALRPRRRKKKKKKKKKKKNLPRRIRALVLVCLHVKNVRQFYGQLSSPSGDRYVGAPSALRLALIHSIQKYTAPRGPAAHAPLFEHLSDRLALRLRHVRLGAQPASPAQQHGEQGLADASDEQNEGQVAAHRVVL
eukprot:scaffold5635_cov120-Isochrysis_galbana.AAC.3